LFVTAYDDILISNSTKMKTNTSPGLPETKIRLDEVKQLELAKL
jgi:hypothetical protein